MAAFLLRILIFISALWFVRRLLTLMIGGISSPSRSRTENRPAAPGSDTVRDPVCGMYMDPRLALRVDNGKGSFYFCSDECKNKYLSHAR
jgi:YHS domain-containing protein